MDASHPQAMALETVKNDEETALRQVALLVVHYTDACSLEYVG